MPLESTFERWRKCIVLAVSGSEQSKMCRLIFGRDMDSEAIEDSIGLSWEW
jgi:hypothetical protein